MPQTLNSQPVDYKLKPCPFCGGSAYIHEDADEDGDPVFFAACETYGCIMSFGHECRVEWAEMAARLWNTRCESGGLE